MISLVLISLAQSSLAYRPGDLVPMSRMGQYHSVRTHFFPFILLWAGFSFLAFWVGNFFNNILQSRTVWHDMIGRHCPMFAVNREVFFLLRNWISALWFCFSSPILFVLKGKENIHVSFNMKFSNIILCIWCRCWYHYQNLLVTQVLIHTKCEFEDPPNRFDFFFSFFPLLIWLFILMWLRNITILIWFAR